MLSPDSTRSWMIAIVPKTARPMRQVSPTTIPARLRIAEMRWRVRSIILAEVADVLDDVFEVFARDVGVVEFDFAPVVARCGLPPEIEDQFDQFAVIVLAETFDQAWW